jgi:carbonic anhydrase
MMALADQLGNKLANATRRNVIDTIAQLKTATPILSAAVDNEKLKIAGGVYRLGDGKVEMVT